MTPPPSIDQIAALLRQHVPHLSGAEIRPVETDGTDNFIFRIGERHCLRTPRREGAAGALQREALVLPLLDELPLGVPELVAQGLLDTEPARPWLVCSWLEGDPMKAPPVLSPGDAARLALCLLELQGCAHLPGAAAGPQNHYRGVDLIERDRLVMEAVATLSDEYDRSRMEALWTAALDAPRCAPGDRTWLHGDLHPGNLLIGGDGLAGVIDWGLAGIGDPACDLMAAYTVFAGESRKAFAAATAASVAAWERGRGWALSTAAIALAFYRGTDAAIVARSRHTLEELLSEAG